jgi:hypothetical protein
VIGQYEQRLEQLERLENKLQTNSFYLQLIAGLGFSYIAAFLLWNSGNYGIEASTAIGISLESWHSRIIGDAFLGKIGKKCGQAADQRCGVDYQAR